MIPVSEPLLGDVELKYVSDSVRSGWVSSAGPFIDQFEQEWAARCDRMHGVAVSNGTAALQLAVAALNLEPGAEIIMPTFTIISCAMAALYTGCKPVLVDAEADTWCMNVDQVADRITRSTRAIMPVHIYGHPVEMEPLMELADHYGLHVVEDAAEAHGALYRRAEDRPWEPCGSFGDVSAFSFYANKLVTTGEGGMVLTDDAALADKARSLRNLGFHSRQRFHHESLGFNFRMTNLQAALGVAQLTRFDDVVTRKRWIAKAYGQRLAEVSGLELPVERDSARSVYWMYGVVLADECPFDAVELAARMRARGVETRPFFLGMHEQPALLQRGLFGDEHHPVAERLARRGLYLPSGPALSEHDIDLVVTAIHQSLAE